MLVPRRRRRVRLLSTLALVSCWTVAGAATLTVVNTNASGAGSLAQAITSANADTALDTIEFAIPGGGVPTIVASLPAVTQPVLIDGTTQGAGFVEIQNGGGVALSITGSGSTVRGLVLNSSGTGISLGAAAAGNTITGCRIGTDPTGTVAVANQVGVFVQSTAGTNTIVSNLISGNTPTGISIVGDDAVIVGNVIGLDVTQTVALGGSTGVLINAGDDNRVGGTGSGEGNVIAGLGGNRISVQGAAARNVIQGNRIGTNAANAAGLGTNVGVSFSSVTGADNALGGADVGAGNLIVAASGSGVSALNSSRLTIRGNTIGTAALPNGANGVDMANADGSLLADNLIGPNGQAGITFRSGADGNTVRGNEITGNGGGGITVSGGQMDRFTENAIHDNTGLGIDLGAIGVAVNDALDADVAPGHNDAQNYPVLSMVDASGVTGTLNSLADTTFTVEFFASPTCDASGNGEGATFLGAVQVMTDASGDADLAFPLPPEAAGLVITATATAPDGDTSEFSACTGAVPATTTTTAQTTTTAGATTTTSTTTTTAAPTTTAPSTTSTTTSTTTTSTTGTTSSSTSSTAASSSTTSSSTSSTTTTASTTTSPRSATPVPRSPSALPSAPSTAASPRCSSA
jgi:parallel beta-helix repeat protein